MGHREEGTVVYVGWAGEGVGRCATGIFVVMYYGNEVRVGA